MKIVVNPDSAFEAAMRKALRENEGYCPCMPEKTEDTKCMCADFRGMEEGACHCELYTKVRTPSDILPNQVNIEGS